MISTRSSKNLRAKLPLACAVAFLAAGFLRAADAPVYLSELPNINDYTLFANGGWDGNWYVGYNTTWVKRLPAAPKGNFTRAYIGAKLGRAKTLPPVGRPPEFNPIPGEFWMAVASTTQWKAEQQFKLASTSDIPLEPSPEYALENVGESQWFWVEVPLTSINFSGENYLALWSPTPAFMGVSSSPVLAAGWGGKDVSSWLANNAKGEPPKNPQTYMSKGLSYFHPGLAMKLIPSDTPGKPEVRVKSWQNGTTDYPKPIVNVLADGNSVERVWIERNNPIRRGDVIRGNWVPVGRSQWRAPYIFSLDFRKLPKGRQLLRACAVSIWEEQGCSEPFEIEVSEIRAK